MVLICFDRRYVETNDISRVGPLTEVSMCDPLNLARIVDPVVIPSSTQNKSYTRQSLLARMEGGSMYQKSSPYSSLVAGDLKDDVTMKFLLLNLPFSDETVLCQLAKPKKPNAASGAAEYV